MRCRDSGVRLALTPGEERRKGTHCPECDAWVKLTPEPVGPDDEGMVHATIPEHERGPGHDH
jgi:hypothetical protein